MEKSKKDVYFLNSVGNALKILDVLSVKRSLSLNELVKITGINKSSTFKLLFTLESRNYVIKTSNRKYSLGSKFSNYSVVASERASLTEMASLPMRRLRNQSGESIYLGILNLSSKVIIIHGENGTSINHTKVRIGFETDAYTTAQGKVLLAFMEEDAQHRFLSSVELNSKTEKTVASNKLLLSQLHTIRQTGYCESVDERFLGYSDIAAPVFDANGKCVAAVCMVFNSKDFVKIGLQYKSSIISAAASISTNLGY